MEVTQVYFSPSGTTQRVCTYFTNALCGQSTTLDLLKAPVCQEVRFSKEQLLVAALPVFAGRIPAVCAQSLDNLKGQHTPAVAIVVYGNRDYDDALLELCDILNGNGFAVMAAAAFIAQHSIFSVAKNRPDKEDLETIAAFAAKCGEKYGGQGPIAMQAAPKGNRPYKALKPGMLKPTVNENCTKCGLCAQVCPVKAIEKEEPTRTNAEKCIACTACIARCPSNARAFTGSVYEQGNAKFIQSYSARLEPEMYC